MGDTDYKLHNKVEQVNNLVLHLDKQLGFVGSQVAAVGTAQQETRNELGQLRSEFLHFVRQAELVGNIQRAETKIGSLQDQVEHEFGHYKVVRRTAVGMLQAFDVGLVSEDTIRTVSEQLMVQTPRYWLAPALVALAAWSGDDQQLSEKATSEAFRRSPSRTSLFFALVTRRQRRQEAAVRWLRHYLAAQDPNALGRDFAVILESIAQGAFGPAGRELVHRTMGQWTAVMLTNHQAHVAQVARWRAEVESHRAAPAGADFPRLGSVSPQWPDLELALSSAGTHQSLIDDYGGLMTEVLLPAERLEDAIDDILDRLVSEYDNEELPLRRALAYNAAVIDHGGDLDAARRSVDVASGSLEDTLDFLTIQTTSALDPGAIGVSRSTQRLAIAACHEWFAAAHASFSKDYRARVPSDVQAVFDSSQSFGAQVFTLPRWTGTFTNPMEELEQSLANHWDQHIGPFIDSLAFQTKRAAIVPGIVVLLILVLIVPASAGLGLLLALVVGGVWCFMIYLKYNAALEAQQTAREHLEREKKNSIGNLRAAGAELTDWTTRYKEADQVEPTTRVMIKALATAGHGPSPYERRPLDAVRS